MMSAAAVVLIRRHPRSNWLSRGDGLISELWYPERRSLATQATTKTAQSSIPRLLVTCPPNYESRYLYTLTKEEKRASVVQLKLDREIHLPEISSHWIIGSSHGYLISMPLLCGIPRDIHFMNPITRDSHRIPVSCEITGRVKASKAILSPSIDKLVLLPSYYTKQIGLADFYRSPVVSPWTHLDVPTMLSDRLHDCIFHNNRLYVTDAFSSVALYHSRGSSVWRHVYKPQEDEFSDKSMLVESPEGDDLYLIVKTTRKKNIHFKVFKFDESVRKWENVESIGELAVFVGRNGAICLHAHHSPLLKPNCIYFFGDDYRYKEPGTQSMGGVYYLKSKRFKRIGASDDDRILNPAYSPPILFQPEACPTFNHDPRLITTKS